jgi:hypothetical protein
MYSYSITLHAQWNVQQVTLTITAPPINVGHMTSPTSLVTQYAYGSQVSLAAAVDTTTSGYSFRDWVLQSGSATIASTTSATTSITLTGNAAVKSEWDYGWNLQVGGHGGNSGNHPTALIPGGGYAIQTDANYASSGFWVFNHWYFIRGTGSFDDQNSPSTVVHVTSGDSTGSVAVAAAYDHIY